MDMRKFSPNLRAKSVKRMRNHPLDKTKASGRFVETANTISSVDYNRLSLNNFNKIMNKLN